MRKIIVLFALWSLFAATTYILKENGMEVGRLEDQDGKSEVKMVEGAAGTPAAQAPAMPALPVPGSEALPEIPWSTGNAGYEAALHRQKQTGEPVMLYFYATWCPYCHELEKNILDSSAGKKGLAPALKVRIDAEKEPKLAEKYGVRAYPRLFIVNQKGEKHRINTSLTVEEFLRLCRGYGMKIA